MKNLLLDAALRLAGLGYPVLPCKPESKIPATEHGCLDATCDIGRIRDWWKLSPGDNLAVATTGLLVLDVDDLRSPWFVGLGTQADDLDAAPSTATPRGGRHWFFRQPDSRSWRNTVGRLGHRIDTRADGGYVVVPPSGMGKRKGVYSWVKGQALDCVPDNLPLPPLWLVDLLDGLDGQPAGDDGAAGWAGDSNPIPDGQRNATLCRIGGSLRRIGLSADEIAAALQAVNRRCLPPLSHSEVEGIARSVARYEPSQAWTAVVEGHYEQDRQERQRPEPSSAAPDDPGPVPERLLRVPGFVAELMDYTLATAAYPEPTLAFCGAVALQSLLAGRKVRDAMDNRTNLYLLGLANSGSGKDYPRKVNQRVLLEVGLVDAVGDSFASSEGLEDRLLRQPACLFQTDEFDGLVAKVNSGDSRYEAIMQALLKLYSSANGLYPMRVKAGQQDAHVINQPTLVVYGTAVPKHYYESLSTKMLTNGFFARFLVLETGRRGCGQDAHHQPIPARVLDAAAWWAGYVPGGHEAGNLAGWNPSPATVPHDADAASFFRDFMRDCDGRYAACEAAQDAIGMATWARANEKARRLALVYACSARRDRPAVTLAAAEWACELARHQTLRMLAQAAQYVTENEHDRKCKALLQTLRAWRELHGDDWMPFWRVSRLHPWLERDHEAVRLTLVNQRLLEAAQINTSQRGGRPGKVYRIPPA